MKYQIDQSIKIENTQKTSYVCLANGIVTVSTISAKEKRVLELFFRKIERLLIFKLFTFSVLCAKVIRAAKPGSVEIDTEYSSHEINIKSFIVQLLSIWNYKTQINIYFGYVGKHSAAHIKRYKAYKSKIRGIRVNAQEVLVLYNLVNKA